MRRRALRVAAVAGLLALVGSGQALGAGAVGPPASRLLPAEQAFRFSARALDPQTIEARFTVADGYYLYRDKLKFSAAPHLGLATPVLPKGELKQDEFFGRVETYRGVLLVRLAVPGGVAGGSVVIQAESQGCADAGVCYPPNLQTVALSLPVAAGPGSFVDAVPPKKYWFN
jgi:thiol:disulfide interchange protein DsbD